MDQTVFFPEDNSIAKNNLIKQKVFHMSGWPCKRCTTKLLQVFTITVCKTFWHITAKRKLSCKKTGSAARSSVLQCFSARFCDRLEIAMLAWDNLEVHSSQQGSHWIWSTPLMLHLVRSSGYLLYIIGCSTISILPNPGWRKIFCCNFPCYTHLLLVAGEKSDSKSAANKTCKKPK